MKIKKQIKRLTAEFYKFTYERRYLLKPFVVLFLIYLVAISAILLAGVHYADDIARTSYGYAGWAGFSRYLSTILSHGLHADNYLSNIAPLPQIIAVGFLAVASVIVICLVSGKEVFKEKWTRWIWRVIAVVPLGLCPYFLECLSYQYDAPYMALSVLFAVFPLIFRKKSRTIYMTVLVLSLGGMCMTYQASAGIFLVLMLFLGLKDWNEGGKTSWRESLKFLVWSGAGFLLVMLVFSKFLMIPKESYVSNDIPELNIFLSEFVKHLDQYFNLVVTDFKLLWLVLIGIIGLCFVLLFTMRSRQNKILAVFVAVVGLLLMLIAIYAPYSALAKPLYATRAMYAIGSLIAVAGVYIISERGWQKLATVPVFVLAWCFFVFAFTYGNALKEQNDYRNMQVNMVISDLNELLPKLSSNTKNLQIGGQIGYTPVITHMPNENYCIIHRLIKSTFGRNVPWMAYRLTEGPILPGTSYDSKLNLQNKNLPTLKDTVFYTIRGDNHNVLVEFKGEQMKVDF
ncbi:glucosyltransferase domain-containing protein [Candidatus Saccharibacteria bacterium]|nr:glucosyltransferase domain-containing protein [Candidatus Saccharibacteria bacterium]MBR3157053.1 glucosyltransferase domain-containing protein [Candidatus Saccharibacteria bacterium]